MENPTRVGKEAWRTAGFWMSMWSYLEDRCLYVLCKKRKKWPAKI